jgi:hypothetical protein
MGLRSLRQILLGVVDDFLVHVLGDLGGNAHGDVHDPARLETGQVAEYGVWAAGWSIIICEQDVKCSPTLNFPKSGPGLG